MRTLWQFILPSVSASGWARQLAIIPTIESSDRPGIPPTNQENDMRNSGKAPTFAVWIISMILFIVALAGHFGVVRISDQIVTWSWIIGFGLLLLACRIKGL